MIQTDPGFRLHRFSLWHLAHTKDTSLFPVTISGIDNGTSVLLQALSNDGRSGGLWETESEAVSCSSNEYLVQKNVSGNGTRTRWTSPNNANSAAVLIR